MAKEACENCRFARTYQMPPGECPPEPEPPKPVGFWKSITFVPSFSLSAEFYALLKRWSWLDAEDRAKHYVKCERFPEAIKKHKADWCGEYEPRGE